MASGNTSKSVFPADIFSEDNDKWSWSSTTTTNPKNSAGSINYAALRKVAENESDSNSGSEQESAVHSDSNSMKRSFRPRASSSNSEGNHLEDASSSSAHFGPLPHERVLPSMYDDDARSASPSAYEKKDLAFVSSFQEFNPLPPKNLETNTFLPFDKVSGPEKATERRSSKDKSTSPSRGSKSESRRSQGRRSSRSRSPSRDKRAHHRSRSRSRSRGKRPRSPVRDRRRSRSRDRHSERDRAHSSRNKSRSSDPRRSRSRSRDSRRRSRSHGRDYRRSRSRSYDRHRRSHRSSSRDRYRRRRHSRSRSRERPKARSGSGNRKPGSLPLSTPGGAMTPQMALQQTMAAMSAKAQALTGVEFPKYYNPAAVNPLKYAEQVQKRKLLWQKEEKVVEQPKDSVWDKLQFAQDQDGKMTAKFRKLMGIKSDTAPKEPEAVPSVLKKQEEIFRDLDQQYEVARMTTHTQRGLGLGYSAQAALYPPVQK